MTANSPTRFICPACHSFLGTTDGDHFEPPPCQCGWQVILKRVKRVPKDKERLSGTPARI